MSDLNVRVPSYRKKKVGKRRYGCVTLPDGLGGRRDILLGAYGTKESKAKYAKAIAEWEAADRRAPTVELTNDLTINELILAYLPYAERHYRHPDGSTTTELNNVKLSLRPLKELYGFTLAKDFKPLALKAVRDQMIRQPIKRKIKVIDPATGKRKWQEKVLRIGLARGLINQRIGRIRRVFKWASENELVPASVYHGLECVRGLQRGRSDARETEPVRPVSVALVEETLPHLNPTVVDMLRLQLLTGARSGEICLMRACDIDITGAAGCWLFTPKHHKISHRGFGRVIPLGPQAQEIVKRYLKPNIEAYLFSPADAMETLRQKRRRERKSKVQPSQVCRKKKQPHRQPGERYKPTVIAYAVRRACVKAGVEHWHPHQLRHTKATEIRREYGLDAARALLGQHAPQVTELYAELDQNKAVEVARKLG
jgi:integrase